MQMSDSCHTEFIHYLFFNLDLYIFHEDKLFKYHPKMQSWLCDCKDIFFFKCEIIH